MLRIRSSLGRSLLAGAAGTLVAATTVGCHHRADDAGAPRQEASASGTRLERSAMNETATSFIELIQGRLPGVLIRQRGTNISVQIRGQGSFGAGNEALILIDGVENTTRSLASINPADVHRVEVIKDGAAAMYGMRGANGVLLITTRRQ